MEKLNNINKWDELRKFLRTKLTHIKRDHIDFNSILILTHRNPDPDSIASAWGLKTLFLSEDIKSVLAYSGSILRPENRALVDILEIKMMHIENINFPDYPFIVLVDTQAGTGNNDLPDDIIPDIVIDHHPNKIKKSNNNYVDIRKETGSTSTIITEYIMMAGITFSSELATALYYGIITDTLDFSRDYQKKDLMAAQFLYQRHIPEILAKIKYPSVSLKYFTEFINAFKTSIQCDDLIGVDAGKISTPDVLAQVVDMIIHVQGIQWAIAVGDSDGIVNFSIRSNSRSRQAGIVAQKIVKGIGTAGGHNMTAGGQVQLKGEEADSIKKNIISLFFKEFGKEIDDARNVFNEI